MIGALKNIPIEKREKESSTIQLYADVKLAAQTLCLNNKKKKKYRSLSALINSLLEDEIKKMGKDQ